MHTQAYKAMERALELARPAGKTSRDKCLFLFEDESLARKYSAMANLPKLYVVTSGSILHRGDITLLSNMATCGELGEKVSNEARAYWKGQLTRHPRVEVLARSGTIIACIGYAEEEPFQGSIRREREDEEERERQYHQRYLDDLERASRDHLG
jgi:hypothetical protein